MDGATSVGRLRRALDRELFPYAPPPPITARRALICAGLALAAIAVQLVRMWSSVPLMLLPVVGVEALDNVTNSIWFLLFASFWILLWHPASFARAGAGFVLLAALSNVAILVFAPCGPSACSPSATAAMRSSSPPSPSGSRSSSPTHGTPLCRARGERT
jgi:hypothetical protein